MEGKARFMEIIGGIEKGDAPARPCFFSETAALFNRDCLEVLPGIGENTIDMIFADPPYLLSNGGLSCRSGRMASVNKGRWDESRGFEEDLRFHEAWIGACRRVLKPEGTIWISGTYHSIYQCGYLLQKKGFHILNDIAWFKPNAAPNLSCRFFTASHETIIWARKDKKAKHTFNYDAMKNGGFPGDKLKKPGTQMRSVWSIPAPGGGEKSRGKHPTQKPLDLLLRIIRASTTEGDLILDPFNGSGTTGLAAALAGGRYYIGLEIDGAFCELTAERLRSAAGPLTGAPAASPRP
jgi:site-specific DNA-methyltransferase (adenine-specific)